MQDGNTWILLMRKQRIFALLAMQLPLAYRDQVLVIQFLGDSGLILGPVESTLK